MKSLRWPALLASMALGMGAALVVGGCGGGDGDDSGEQAAAVAGAQGPAGPAGPAGSSDPGTATTPLTDADVIGTWESQPETGSGGEITTYSFALNAGGGGTFGFTTQHPGPPPFMSGAAGPGTWQLVNNVLILSDSATFTGASQVNNNQVTINGRTYTKQ